MDIVIKILSIAGEEKYKIKLKINQITNFYLQINYYHLQLILNEIIIEDNIYYLLDNDKIIYANFDDLNYNIIEINNNYLTIIFIPIKLKYIQKLRYYNEISLNHKYYTNFIDTYAIVKFAISCCPYNLKYASENLRNNIDIVKIAIKKDVRLLENASENIRNNFDIVKMSVEENGEVLEYASENLKNNFDIVKIAVEKNGIVLLYASENLRNNFDIVKIAINSNCEAIQYVSDNLRDNLEIIELACKYYIIYIHYASIRLQNNFDIMRNIIIKFIKNMQTNEKNYYYVMVRHFLEDIASINVLLYQKVIDDYDIAMNIIKYNPHTIEYFSENIKNNYNIGLMAVTNDGACLKFLSKTLKEDKIIVRTAITQKFKSYTLQFAPKLQDDYDTVILAVMNEASSLKYASKRLREDYNIVKAAFNNNKTSLKHASKNIKHLFR